MGQMVSEREKSSGGGSSRWTEEGSGTRRRPVGMKMEEGQMEVVMKIKDAVGGCESSEDGRNWGVQEEGGGGPREWN